MFLILSNLQFCCVILGQLFRMVSIVSINQLRHVSQDIDTFGGREGWQRHSISCCLSWTWGLAMSLRCAPLEGQNERAQKGLWGQTETDSDQSPALASSSGRLVPTCVLRTSCLNSLSLPFFVWIMDITVTIMQDNVRTEWENISRNKTQMKLSRKQIQKDTCTDNRQGNTNVLSYKRLEFT